MTTVPINEMTSTVQNELSGFGPVMPTVVLISYETEIIIGSNKMPLANSI